MSTSYRQQDALGSSNATRRSKAADASGHTTFRPRVRTELTVMIVAPSSKPALYMARVSARDIAVSSIVCCTCLDSATASRQSL